MKKTYIKPEMDTEVVVLENMIAASFDLSIDNEKSAMPNVMEGKSRDNNSLDIDLW